MPRSSRRLPIKLMEESDSDQDKSSGGDKLHASEISRTSGNSRDGRSSPGLSSTSSCLEFRPEDWEWLSEVLLQPLGSLKLASSVSSLSQVR